MPEILDFSGKPASPGDVNQIASELERDLKIVLQRYDGRVPPGYAAGILFWLAADIHTVVTTNQMMQNAAMMQRAKDAASKIPLQ